MDLHQISENIIERIKFVRDSAEEQHLLDTEWYLDFLDTLNALSLDQDRQESPNPASLS